MGFGRNHSRRTGYCEKSPGACPGPVLPPFPAEGRTFLRTLGAQRASVRPYVHQKRAVFKWLPIEKYKEIERVCVP